MDIDPDTLLYIQGGRPYDPAAGRYLTAGSMASGTYNIYAFANNTPVDRSVRDVRGAGMQGIVGGSPIGAGISALVDGVVDGVVDSIWSTINSFKDGAIAAGEHIRDSWYELSDDNWDAFQSRQSDFFRSWVSHSTFQQLLEPLWLNQKHGPVTTFATHPSWLESERAAFKTYFETSNRTTSWGYGERFAPLGDEIIVTVVSSVTGRLIPPGAATLARSSRFLIKHLDDVIDVGVDGGRVIARGSNAPNSGVTDFAESTGRLGGKLYGEARLDKLERYLGRRNVMLVRDADARIAAMNPKGNGVFIAKRNGPSELLLRSNATRAEVLHELSHFVHLRRVKFDAYKAAGRLGREQTVYDTLVNNRNWSRLKQAERDDAFDYIFGLGGNPMGRKHP